MGRNGAGKTNLLESLHVATQGFSPRTRRDGQLISFGQSAGRVVVTGRRASARLELSVTLRDGQAKEARVNGARLASAEALRREAATLVFTPDRLAVVKGGPAARRAYFDRVLARLHPARASLAQDYLATLAQRNASLRRVQLGLSDQAAVEPWTGRLASLAAELVASREETLAQLGRGFGAHAHELGLEDARLSYDGKAPTGEELTARLPRDIERGSTGLGPHLDDVRVASGNRDLREFGSQGEQRVAVLSLLLAEAALLDPPPLLLLDDVLSELDLGRRRMLAELLVGRGQAVLSTTHAAALPLEPTQVVEVSPGTAR